MNNDNRMQDDLAEDETSLSDLNPLAGKNMFEASEEANRGENHPVDEYELNIDNAISYQDPELRLA